MINKKILIVINGLRHQIEILESMLVNDQSTDRAVSKEESEMANTQRVLAMKMYRNRVGCTLLEARQVIENHLKTV